jgi:hypothetical protein
MTAITNLSAEPMPVSVGFHPYFQLTDSPRDEWTISVGARTHLKLTPNKLPTGETEALAAPFTGGVPLRDYELDDSFMDLVRDEQGRATMTVSGKTQRLDVQFGPNYRAAQVWSRSRRTSSASSRWRRSPTGSTWRRKGSTRSCNTSRPAARGARVSGSLRKGSDERQFPTANYQRPTTPNLQFPTKIVASLWELGIGSGWKLGVGSWEFSKASNGSYRHCMTASTIA